MADFAVNTHQQEDWVEKFARIGYAAKGAVYALIGGLSLAAALGIGGDTTDRKELFNKILTAPFGQVLLGIIAFGLIGFAVWRIIQATKDTENAGDDTKGIVKRIGFFISGLIYLGFSVYAGTLIFGSSGGSGSSSGSSGKELFINKLLEQPFGRWLVALVALIIIGKGIAQFWKGFSGSYNDDVKDAQVEQNVKKTYDTLGKLGYLSRGVVLGIVGVFFFIAGINANPSEAKGTEGVFNFLSQSGGPWLMGLIALGLLGYGVFMFVKAKYKTISPS